MPAAVPRAIVWRVVLPPWQGPDEPSPRCSSTDSRTSRIRTAAILTTTRRRRSRRRVSTPIRLLRRPRPAAAHLARATEGADAGGPDLWQRAGLAHDRRLSPLYHARLVPFVRLPELHAAASRLYAAGFRSAIVGGLLRRKLEKRSAMRRRHRGERRPRAGSCSSRTSRRAARRRC